MESCLGRANVICDAQVQQLPQGHHKQHTYLWFLINHCVNELSCTCKQPARPLCLLSNHFTRTLSTCTKVPTSLGAHQGTVQTDVIDPPQQMCMVVKRPRRVEEGQQRHTAPCKSPGTN